MVQYRGPQHHLSEQAGGLHRKVVAKSAGRPVRSRPLQRRREQGLLTSVSSLSSYAFERIILTLRFRRQRVVYASDGPAVAEASISFRISRPSRKRPFGRNPNGLKIYGGSHKGCGRKVPPLPSLNHVD